jgi:hypothetical protein
VVLGIFFVTGFVLGHALVMLSPLWFALFAHVRTVAQDTRTRTPFQDQWPKTAASGSPSASQESASAADLAATIRAESVPRHAARGGSERFGQEFCSQRRRFRFSGRCVASRGHITYGLTYGATFRTSSKTKNRL